MARSEWLKGDPKVGCVKYSESCSHTHQDRKLVKRSLTSLESQLCNFGIFEKVGSWGFGIRQRRDGGSTTRCRGLHPENPWTPSFSKSAEQNTTSWPFLAREHAALRHKQTEGLRRCSSDRHEPSCVRRCNTGSRWTFGQGGGRVTRHVAQMGGGQILPTTTPPPPPTR